MNMVMLQKACKVAAINLSPTEEIKMKKGHFVIYKDEEGKFRWQAVGANGRLVAECGNSYASKQMAKTGIEIYNKNMDVKDIRDVCDE